MEATPALRNNWDYGPGPQQQLMASSAQLNSGIEAYGQRRAQFALQQQAAQNAERLQQLRLNAAAQNLKNRDQYLMQWHTAHDKSVLEGQKTAEKARADAEAERGAQSRLTDLQKTAAQLNVQMPMKAPGESTDAYASRVSGLLQPAIDKQNTGYKIALKTNMSGLADNYNKLQGIKQNVTSQANQMVVGSIPQWVQGQDPALVAAYSKNITNGMSPTQAISAVPGLASSFQSYVQAQVPALSNKIMNEKGYTADVNAISMDSQRKSAYITQFLKSHPQAGDIYTQASTELTNEEADKAAQVAKVADDARKAGADSETQARLDAQAKAAQDSANRIKQAHDQATNSLQQIGIIGKAKQMAGGGALSLAPAFGADNENPAGAVGGAARLGQLVTDPTTALTAAAGRGAYNVLSQNLPTAGQIGTDANALLFGTPSGPATPDQIAARRAQLGIPAPGTQAPAPAAPTPPVSNIGFASAPATSPQSAIDLQTPRYSTADVMNLMGINSPASAAPASSASTPAISPLSIPQMPDTSGDFLNQLSAMNNYQAMSQLNQ